MYEKEIAGMDSDKCMTDIQTDILTDKKGRY